VSAEHEEIERPQTSTRDRDELGARLQTWLQTQLGPTADARVTKFAPPDTNGMSSETLLFNATWNEGGAPRDYALVARVAPDPGAVPVFPEYDLDRQFRTMQRVSELTSVPVPRLFWSETDPEHLGAPFFVMERIDGVVPPDIMPYTFGDNWLFDGTEADRQKLQDATVNVLAQLHAIDDPQSMFPFLASKYPGATALERHLNEQHAYYEWVVQDGVRSPLIEACFAWLDEHRPRDEGSAALSWGDARIGNILYRDFEPVAVLDWEMATFDPPEVDLGWCIALHCFFEDIAHQYGFPGLPTFMQRDDVATTYEKLSGHTPRDLDWYTMFAAARHGIIMFRIHRRAVQFGQAETPDDPDDMISHRAMLESMLAGTYWSNS
jgi:aminoglycoside phosphotransferase (APT) family kinase protein